MSEEDIKRVEDKVNLLYKILLELKEDYLSHPYKRTYILNFIDELIPLFNISAKKEIIKDLPNQGVIDKNIQELLDELEKLEKDYEDGNFLAKDREKLNIEIKNLTDSLSLYKKINNVRKEIEDSNTEIYNIRLFEELKNKLRIEQQPDDREWPSLDDLQNKIDDLQKNMGELRKRLKEIEKRTNFQPKTTF